jgi:hypothetical protein
MAWTTLEFDAVPPYTMGRERIRSAAGAHLDHALSAARCALRLAAQTTAEDTRTEILSAALRELEHATAHLQLLCPEGG